MFIALCARQYIVIMYNSQNIFGEVELGAYGQRRPNPGLCPSFYIHKKTRDVSGSPET